jgi:hypothetical protein
MLYPGGKTMHLRLTRLTLASSFALCSLAAVSQIPSVDRPRSTTSCVARSVDQQCPSGAIVIPYPSQPPTLERMEREALLSQSEAPAPRPAPRGTAEATLQLQRTPLPDPDAADQSELLKNAKDREFILRNFKTMYVSTGDIKYFDEQQMKSALMRNPDFKKLNIRIVSDRRFADVYLVVSYTFAWDYPFELRHQNTTTALLAGKGEGPFSGPLGAADVAREFVDLAKPWRVPTAPKK